MMTVAQIQALLEKAAKDGKGLAGINTVLVDMAVTVEKQEAAINVLLQATAVMSVGIKKLDPTWPNGAKVAAAANGEAVPPAPEAAPVIPEGEPATPLTAEQAALDAEMNAAIMATDAEKRKVAAATPAPRKR